MSMRDSLSMSFPIRRRTFNNWDDMEKVSC